MSKPSAQRKPVRTRTTPVVANMVDKHGGIHGTLVMYEWDVKKTVSSMNKLLANTCEGQYRYVLPDGYEA